MVRRSYRYSRTRRTRPLKTVKYSNETYTTAFQIPPNSSVQQHAYLVAPITAQGMRKAKNFTLRIACSPNSPLIFWALVYVPDGTLPQNLIIPPFVTPQQPTAVSFYEPNQNVIMSGSVYPNSPQETYRTRLARNLNSGDSLVLLVRCPYSDAAAGTVFASCNYAISY